MSLACEAEIKVHNECALRFSIVFKPVPVLEYIKAISSLVGASHILAIFEENDSLKVFFDDRRFVDTLIKSGVHVLGHHVGIDYVVPPGIKVILSNVDPVISNVDVIKVLSDFGTVVSPCIRPPISDDTELCHIGYGVRYVYMTLNESVPNRIEFKFGDQIYCVKASIEEKPTPFISIPYIKTDDCESNYDETNCSPFESLPGPSGILNSVENSDPILVHPEGSSQPQIESSRSLMDTSAEKRRRGRPRKAVLANLKKVTATSQAARRIKRNVKQKLLSLNTNHYNKNMKHGVKKTKSISTAKISEIVSTQISEVDTISIPSSSENKDTETIDDMDTSPYEPVVDKQNMLRFLEEVKHHRVPLEVAKKFIGIDCDSKSVLVFCRQLHDFATSQNHHHFKQRIFRVAKSLKDAM